MKALIWNPRILTTCYSWPRTTSSLLTNTTTRLFSSVSNQNDVVYTNQSRGGLPRFHSLVLPPSQGNILRVVGDEFWHMTKVLRLNTNDRIELFDGKGGIIKGFIKSVDRGGLDFVALEDPKVVSPPTGEWHVFAAFGTLKGGRADWLVEKCTELGAKSLTPLLTERSNSFSENRFNRMQRVIVSATKQCQRLHEMTINRPANIKALLPIVAKSKLSLVAVAEATPVINVLTSSKLESPGLMIIGPEGDFTEKEVNMIIEAGATTVGLGPHRLRVETATMTLLATLMLWSDSQQISCQ
ncbi:16S rRNA (uracil(1498)-N(3))-methyltransferase [Heracleum sosnowskyi]|uniref:16S rRNA (uracil(1498)-N(3))-methyltransferase n=1 Tax=Heracleum sosnowskyi TaxID=360622 RepID=A0AAD8IJ25_9APIA|nr:16S rRNA (uracil(1498)-N(3))-methyltransferase [Heracleum sosnowskyi]